MQNEPMIIASNEKHAVESECSSVAAAMLDEVDGRHARCGLLYRRLAYM